MNNTVRTKEEKELANKHLAILKHRLEIITAYLEGKTIQWKNTISKATTPWEDISSPSWSWHLSKYRIKPELVKCWVNIYSYAIHYYETRDEAVIDVGPDVIRLAVPLVELAEETTNE